MLKLNCKCAQYDLSCRRAIKHHPFIHSFILPPHSPIDIKKVERLINQLPKPFILMGDFNSHHTLWGCIDTNDNGRIIEDFITDHDLVLLNDKSSTYLILLLVHIHHWTLLYAALEFFQNSHGRFVTTFMEVITSRSKYRK